MLIFFPPCNSKSFGLNVRLGRIFHLMVRNAVTNETFLKRLCDRLSVMYNYFKFSFFFLILKTFFEQLCLEPRRYQGNSNEQINMISVILNL